MKFHCFKHRLQFKFDAGTSRGILKEKNSYFIKIWDENNPSFQGIGEAGPLLGLSPEYRDDLLETFENRIQTIFHQGFPLDLFDFNNWIKLNPIPEASFQMAFEMAILNYLNKKEGAYFTNNFYLGKQSIPINGLIWMGSKEWMLAQIKEKISLGFTCLKLKIGAIGFEDELALLEFIRENYSAQDLIIRVDANGAFSPQEALKKLESLAKYDLHSIEQPIQPKQYDLMNFLCRNSPVPIALDEELIGIRNNNDKLSLIEQIQPQFLIFKPSLLGGFCQTEEWIELADQKNIPWWITSALESNIGLDAIAQFTGQFDNPLPHGLGTGGLYENNFDTDLTIHQGRIFKNK